MARYLRRIQDSVFSPHNGGVGPAQLSSVSTTLLCSFVALVVIIAVGATKPPTPKSMDVPADQFSSARAIAHLPHIASRAHVVGSEENALVCDYLLQVLRDLGGDPHVETTVGVLQRGPRVYAGTARNIVSVLHGTGNSRSIMLVAHYDSGERGPGAADDGLGLITILETIRALRAGPRLKNDLVVLFTDGEEAGLLGASGYVRDHPDLSSQVGIVLNFEARGSSGPVYMFETSEKAGWLEDEFARAASRPLASSLMYTFYQQLPNDTDMTVFKQAGLPGLNFAVIGSHENYHTRLDLPQNLDPSSVQQTGSSALALVEHFGNLELQSFRQPDRVYFNWLGTQLIEYPMALVPIFLFLAAVLLITLVILSCRKGLACPKLLALNIVGLLLLLAAVIAAAELEWKLAVTLTKGHLLFGDTSSNYLILSSTILGGLGAGLYVLGWLVSKFGAVNPVLGQTLILASLAALVSAKLPGASYIFEWPLIFGLLGTCVLISGCRPGLCAICGFLVSIPALLIFAPLIPQLLVSFDMTDFAVIATALLIGLLILSTGTLLVHIVTPSRRVACGLIILSVACLVPGACLSRFSSTHPHYYTLFYTMNVDLGDAAWASFDDEPDAWTSQFVGSDRTRTTNPQLLLGRDRALLMRKAPVVPILPPDAKVISDEKVGNCRLLKLHLSTLRGANVLEVKLPPHTGLDNLAWNHRRVRVLSREGYSVPWELRYANLPPEGVDLELSLPSQSRFTMWLGDVSYGLPRVPGFEHEQRPENMMAWWGSDITLVGRKYEY